MIKNECVYPFLEHMHEKHLVFAFVIVLNTASHHDICVTKIQLHTASILISATSLTKIDSNEYHRQKQQQQQQKRKQQKNIRFGFSIRTISTPYYYNKNIKREI